MVINLGRKKKNKKNKKLLIEIIIAIIIIVAGVYFGKDYIPEEYLDKINDSYKEISSKIQGEAFKENIITETDGNLKVYFIDVGQADSILVINKNESMLIDAGNNQDGELVSNYIKSLGINKINYLIGTHPHEDHIGGLDNIINNFEIDNIYLPEKTTNTKTYEDVLDAIANKNLKITVPKIGDSFKVGLSENEIIWVGNEDNLNNSSIVIKTTYGRKSFLFTGDAEAEVEAKMKLSEADVLKVGHHGSSSSTSQILLNKVKPRYAIISVGKDNDYGHPTKKILDRLDEYGCEVHRTDKEGTIILTTDGENIEINTMQTKTNGN